jgi:hypothetical protein
MDKLDEILRRSEVRKTWLEVVREKWLRCRYCSHFGISEKDFIHAKGCLVLQALASTEDDIAWMADLLKRYQSSPVDFSST